MKPPLFSHLSAFCDVLGRGGVVNNNINGTYVVGRRWWRFYFTPTQQTKYTSSQVKLQKLSSE